MEKALKKRRKGGGRKFADGRISKARFVRSARKWFEVEISISRFLWRNDISRPSYYRFLNKHEWLKSEINEIRTNRIRHQKETKRKLLAWMRENPTKPWIDYYLEQISISKMPEIKTVSIEIKS